MTQGTPGLAALGRSPLFDGLDDEALEGVSAYMRPRRFESGEYLCRAGDAGDSLLLILEGFARVLIADAGDSPRAVARLRRGEIAGEMSLATGEPQSASVVAAVATTALELSRDDFGALIARHPR